LLGAAMITGAFSAGFDWLYGVRIAAAAAVLWACRRAYRSLTWTCSWEACAVGLAIAVMWIATYPLSAAHESPWPASLQSGSGAATAWLALRFIGYVAVVPLVEELAFRVYAMRRLIRQDVDTVPVGTFSLASFVASSLLFGALHGALWIQGTLAGMAFACLLYRRRSVGDAVLAHATTNALIALYVFATGRWSLWS
jgi:CAAX prenyl protease-like protein